MLEALLGGAPTYHRGAMLWAEEFDLARLAPLMARIGGPSGVHGAAEEIEKVGAWLP
jgi:hypothetical protein